jgi:hypothetical protein
MKLENGIRNKSMKLWTVETGMVATKGTQNGGHIVLRLQAAFPVRGSYILSVLFLFSNIQGQNYKKKENLSTTSFSTPIRDWLLLCHLTACKI